MTGDATICDLPGATSLVQCGTSNDIPIIIAILLIFAVIIFVVIIIVSIYFSKKHK